MHEQAVSFRAFSGYFAFGRNSLHATDVCSSVVQPVFLKLQAIEGIGIRAMELSMNKFKKFALGALMVIGAATATTALTTAPAEARTSFSFSFGGPGYYGGYYGPGYGYYGYGPAYYDDYYYRPYRGYYGRPYGYYGRPYYRGYYGGWRGGYRGGYRGGWHRGYRDRW